MKISRKLTAVAIGIVIASGFFLINDSHEHPGPRVVCGIIFGTGMAASMISRPDRITYRHIAFLVAPLLAALVTFTAIYEPQRVVPTFFWALIYIALQVAFLLAGRDEQNRVRSTSERSIGSPPRD